MRKHIVTLVLSVGLVFVQPTPAPAFVGPAILGAVTYLVGKELFKDAKEAATAGIEKADEAVKNRIAQAGDRADESVKLASGEVSKKLQEAKKIIHDAIDAAEKRTKGTAREVFEKAIEAKKEFFADLEAAQLRLFARAELLRDGFIAQQEVLIDRAIRQTENAAQEFVTLLKDHNYVGSPLWKADYRIQRFAGQAQAYRFKGEYPFDMLGSGIGNEAKVEVKLEGKPLPEKFHTSNSIIHRKFIIPAELLNAEFHDTLPVEKTLQIKSNKAIGKNNEAGVKVVLLPKFLASYDLRFDLKGGMEQQGYAPFDHPDFAFTKAEEDLVRKAQKQEGEAVDRAVRERMAVLLALSKTHLRIGTTFIDLPPEATDYRLIVTYVNGDRVVLTRARPRAIGVTATWNELVEPRRLEITLKPDLIQ
jgi:hypothetical protein